MPEGGKLFVTVDQANGGDGASGIIVKIADTGTGIPAYVLPHIFDFAFSTKGNQGSGLGLSVSKDIIEASGGKIAVQTETGRGTEFSIWLPHSSEGQSP
jgi:signal transduction histidine kinase